MTASGETVLLLHGQPGGARDWEPLRAAIGSRVNVIAPDRPGWDGRRHAADLHGNVAAAVAALDAACVERATVAGHSFGGAVAALMAVEVPARVERLVLLAPAANLASLYRIDYLLAAPLAGYVASVAAFGGIGLALTAGRVRRRVADALRLQPTYVEAAGRVLLAPSTWGSFVAEQRTLVSELPALERRLGEIRAPTTIVIGTRDRVVGISSARALGRQIPGAELVVIDHANHLLPQQHADRLAEIVLEGR